MLDGRVLHHRRLQHHRRGERRRRKSPERHVSGQSAVRFQERMPTSVPESTPTAHGRHVQLLHPGQRGSSR